jgi:hypothetical protein
MPSRVWLAAAFVIAFGASPAHAAMEGAAGKPVAALQIRFPRVSCACKCDDTSVEPGDDSNTSAGKRARIRVAD